MVTNSTIISIVISLLITVGAPIILLFIFKKKFSISGKVLLIGMLTFFLFAMVFESIAHFLFLSVIESTKTLLENPWLFMLYGGLMAGIFEEVGRYIMMKYTLKQYRQWKDGLAFGLGHGGIEAILLVGVNNVVMLVFALMINNGMFDTLISGQSEDAFAPIKDQLVNSSSTLFLLGGIERLSVIAIQIGLSVFVLYAVRKKKLIYLMYAIFIHAIIDFPAALYQTGVIKNIMVIELYIALVAIGSIFWIIQSRRLFTDEQPL